MVLEMVRNLPRHWDQRLKSTAELHARIEGLGGLKYLMQAVGLSIANTVSYGTAILNQTPITFHQEMHIRDLDSELEKLESIEGLDSAQAATATMHTDWLDTTSVDTSFHQGLSNLFSLGRVQKVKLENEKSLKAQEAQKAFEECYKQGEPRNIDHQAYLIQICQI